MIVREHVPLASCTTFKVGGTARFVIDCASEEDVKTALSYARERGLPLVVLGEGSNVLPSDAGYEGVIVRLHLEGVTFTEAEGTTHAEAEAGVSWDTLVRVSAERALWGIENLAGIPGTVGAAPVQNIGAYGTELSKFFHSARVLDVRTGEVSTYEKEACGFTYRDSIFKHDPNLIILSVTIVLSAQGEPHTEYADLRALAVEGVQLGSPALVGEAVRTVRKTKFPDLREHGTAGSFFKNPILTVAQFEKLTATYGAVPSFPTLDGIKIPLAYLLDKILGLRGYRMEKVWLFGNQPLVLVADTGARARDVEALAQFIEEKVFTTFEISLEREVRTLQAHETK